MRIKNIVRYLREGIFIDKTRVWFMREIGRRMFNLVSLFLRVNQKKIVFVSFGGKGYGDNPKYIAEYFIGRGGGFELVWLARNKKSITPGSFPASIRIVEYFSFAALYELATAGTWIDNHRKDFYPAKKKAQVYIQTWHGGLTPIKKMEKDAVATLNRDYIKLAKKDSEIADYMLSGCRERTALIKRAFWYNHAILEIGEPRADILLSGDTGLKNTIARKYGLADDGRLILYAPTFRQSNFVDKNDVACYALDYEKTAGSFVDYFHGEKVTILLRMHPNVTALFDGAALPAFVKNVSHVSDMQELLLAADALVTDYSDTQFYFALMKKPVFLLALDYDQYLARERGLYHDFAELPFPLAKTNDELRDNIRAFDLPAYQAAVEQFMREQGFILTGQASKAVYELVATASGADLRPPAPGR